MSLINNVDLNHEEREKIKIKQFTEDPTLGIGSLRMLHREASEWLKANPNLTIVSGEHSSWEDTSSDFKNTEEYRRTINIAYIGEATNANCKHILPKYIITKEPTCTEYGSKKSICRVCGIDIGTEDIDKIPHKYKWTQTPATCTTNIIKNGVCSVCGNTIEKELPNTLALHTYPDDWTIIRKPNKCLDGEKIKKCIVCGHTISQIIKGNGEHNWVYDNNGKHKCTICGTTETCYPSNHGSTCKKCHHINELNLDITISDIDDIEADKEVNIKLTTNADDISKEKWSLVEGTLPDGLTFSEDGTISGTPSINSTGDYNLTFECKYGDQTIRKSFSFKVAPKVCTITFNANGGTIEGSAIKIIKVAAGTKIGELPVAEMEGKVFGGWFTAAVDGLKIDMNYSIAADATFYARFGDEDNSINFGDNTSTFNIQLRNDRTNYNDSPYTLYYQMAGGASGTPTLNLQTGFASDDRSNNITDTNKKVVLYLKVTNTGEDGDFDIGFDCDSYLVKDDDDKVQITRLSNGVKLGVKNQLSVTVPYENTAWIGNYNERTNHRYDNSTEGFVVSNIDTGYAFTMRNIHIAKESYVILEVTFQIP